MLYKFIIINYYFVIGEMEGEVCKIIESQKGKNMIVINGYVMVKNKCRDDLFYWECKHRNHSAGGKHAEGFCKARASTVYTNGQHTLRKSSEHNHAPKPTDTIISEKVTTMKRIAAISQEQPAQIIQAVASEMSNISRMELPSYKALKKVVKRTQNKNNPPEPQTLDDLHIPDELKYTTSGELFLLRESNNDNDKLLLFSCENNIKKLGEATFWIMDGTFKTAPNIFLQLYSIHAPVGGEENSRILPLVYILMSRKCEDLYNRAFQDLSDIAAEFNVQLAPQFILSDFEKAAINASSTEFQTTTNKGCFFHLCQNIWRKIQSCGLSVLYGQDENFCLLMRQIAALAFLPNAEIPEAFGELKNILPPTAEEVVTWFEENYVNGRLRHINRREVRVPPLFQPQLWSVYDNEINGIPRTQNKVEGWHRRWQILVGKNHPGIFYIIKQLRQEQDSTAAEMESIILGQPRPKRKKQYVEKDQRLATIENDRHNRTTLEFLRGIAYNLSF